MKRIAILVAALLALATPSFAQAHDQLDLTSVVLTPNVSADWPITTQITRLDLTPSGIHIEFSKYNDPNRWPDVVPPGWDGPIQYTVWIGARVNGKWRIAASLDCWHGEDNFGGPMTDPAQYSSNLYYLDGELKGHTPVVGEELAFFVTAGAWRGLQSPTVSERSNVIIVPMPTSAGSSYTFSAPEPTPPPTPVVTPEPTPAPAPAPVVSNDAVLAAIADLKQTELDDTAKVLAAIADLKQDIHNGIRQIGDTYLPLLIKVFGAGIIPAGK